MDKVASLELLGNTSLPMGAELEPAVLSGNTAHRVFRWTPLMTAGGGTYQLCFSSADTPVRPLRPPCLGGLHRPG